VSRKPYVNPLVPTHAIDRWLGRIHVATPDSEVALLLGELIDNAPADPRWTRSIRLQAVRYALWRHNENLAQALAVGLR
jgi:hypothetical protein